MTRTRFFLVATVMCALFTGGTGVAATASPNDIGGRAEGLGLPDIVKMAEERASIEYPGSTFYGADAELDESTIHPDDTVAWSLNFSSPEGDFQYVYSPTGEYEKTEPWRRPLGIEPVEKFSMTQGKAVEVLRSAGDTGKFSQLYLAEPLVPHTEPTYYFCMIDKGTIVGVGTHTNKVFKNLFPCY